MAIDANNLGQILQEKGDLEGAREQTERALRIVEKCYGSGNPTTETIRENLAAITRARVARSE